MATAAEKRRLLEGASWNYYDKKEEKLKRRQLAKYIWTLHGLYATVLYLFQDLDELRGFWKHPRIAIVRYRWGRRMQGKELREMWYPINKVAIGGEAGPYEMLDVISRWYGPDGPASRAIDEWLLQDQIGPRKPRSRPVAPPAPGAHRMEIWRWRLQQAASKLEQQILEQLGKLTAAGPESLRVALLHDADDLENRAFDRAIGHLLHLRLVYPTITYMLRRMPVEMDGNGGENGERDET